MPWLVVACVRTCMCAGVHARDKKLSVVEVIDDEHSVSGIPLDGISRTEVIVKTTMHSPFCLITKVSLSVNRTVVSTTNYIDVSVCYSAAAGQRNCTSSIAVPMMAVSRKDSTIITATSRRSRHPKDRGLSTARQHICRVSTLGAGWPRRTCRPKLTELNRENRILHSEKLSRLDYRTD